LFKVGSEFACKEKIQKQQFQNTIVSLQQKVNQTFLEIFGALLTFEAVERANGSLVLFDEFDSFPNFGSGAFESNLTFSSFFPDSD
jgi:hypothetical protein